MKNSFSYVLRFAYIDERVDNLDEEDGPLGRPFSLNLVRLHPNAYTTKIGYAHDHKSCDAMIAAINAGCFGPMSRRRYVIHYAVPESNGDTSYKTDRLFDVGISGKVVPMIPFAYLEGWAKAVAAKSSRRRLRLKGKGKTLETLNKAS